MRQLSSFEEYFYQRRNLNLHSCFYLAITLNESPSRELLSHVITKVIPRYPQLYSNVFLQDEKPIIRPIESFIYFNDVVEYMQEEQLTEELINQIFRTVKFKYHDDVPIWKILALNGGRSLVLCLDHVFFDGLSGVKFLENIMEELNTIECFSNYQDIVYKCEGKELVPKHPYSNWPIPWKWKMFRLLAPLFVKLDSYIGPWVANFTHDSSMLNFNRYEFPKGIFRDVVKRNEIRNDNCQLTFSIPAENLEQLLVKCKKHNVSLTSILISVFIASLKEVDPSMIHGSQVTVDVPVNTRNLIKSTMNIDAKELEMGNFIMAGKVTYDITEDTDLLHTSKKIQDQIVKQKDDVDSIHTSKLLDVVNVEDYIASMANKKFPGSTFEMTNLGFQKFSSLESEKYFVVDAKFNEPQLVASIFTCAVISTPLGGLNCSVSYPKDISTELNVCWAKLKKILDSF